VIPTRAHAANSLAMSPRDRSAMISHVPKGSAVSRLFGVHVPRMKVERTSRACEGYSHWAVPLRFIGKEPDSCAEPDPCAH
jgi:hypothetical protein